MSVPWPGAKDVNHEILQWEWPLYRRVLKWTPPQYGGRLPSLQQSVIVIDKRSYGEHDLCYTHKTFLLLLPSFSSKNLKAAGVCVHCGQVLQGIHTRTRIVHNILQDMSFLKMCYPLFVCVLRKINAQLVLEQMAANTCNCFGFVAIKVICRQITSLLLCHSLTRHPWGRSPVFCEFCHVAVIVSEISVSLTAIPIFTKSIKYLYLNIIFTDGALQQQKTQDHKLQLIVCE
jgi:hypothetical protein